MRIGILGATGPAGNGLAARLASVGHEVLFGSRAVEKARAAVDVLETEWGDRIAGRLIACDNAWACDAPVVILAVNADSAIPTVHEHAERLARKIVVSMANNLVKHGNEFNAVLPPHGSVAAEIQALLWRSRVCTAFHLVPAAEFAAIDHAMESDVVVLGDDDEAKHVVMEITQSIPNLRPLDGGSLRNAVGMETFAAVLLTDQYPSQDARKLATHERMNGGAPDLSGRVIVVTGASRGIGKGLAIGLARLGASIVCAARTVSESASDLPGTIGATSNAITSAGGTAIPMQCDIGDAGDITRLVGTSVAEFGRIDVLVNNAMTPTRASFEEATVQQWDDSMRVNVRSLFLFTKAVAPVMAGQGGGSIINISSGGADHLAQPFMPPGYMIYVVAKAALERYTSAVAPELRELGINMNALRPGAVKTEHTTKELGENADWSGWKTPESVVPAVAYLATQIGTDFTGRVLDVSGFGVSWPE